MEAGPDRDGAVEPDREGWCRRTRRVRDAVRNGGPRSLVRAEPSWCRRHSRRDLGPPQAADVSRHEGPLRDKVKAVSYRETQERHWPEQEEQTDRRGNTKLNKRGRRPRLHRIVGQIQAVAERPERHG